MTIIEIVFQDNNISINIIQQVQQDKQHRFKLLRAHKFNNKNTLQNTYKPIYDSSKRLAPPKTLPSHFSPFGIKIPKTSQTTGS